MLFSLLKHYLDTDTALNNIPICVLFHYSQSPKISTLAPPPQMALLIFTKNKNMGQNGPANFYQK